MQGRILRKTRRIGLLRTICLSITKPSFRDRLGEGTRKGGRPDIYWTSFKYIYICISGLGIISGAAQISLCSDTGQKNIYQIILFVFSRASAFFWLMLLKITISMVQVSKAGMEQKLYAS